MSIQISIEWFFFVIPFLIAYIFSLKHSDVGSWAGSNRDWYWLIFGPITLVVSFASWAIYLKVTK